MSTGIKLKFWFFSHYWWIFLIALVVASTTLILDNQPLNTMATVIGLLLSFVYFLQKQKLEELHLFLKLFKEFNERYDALNEKLALVAELKNEELSVEEHQTLIDYFNLCGEEYLYYSKGYIDPSVWTAWFNGMKSLVAVPRIRKLWLSEKKTESYYGLPI